jgi:hypothetical protein
MINVNAMDGLQKLDYIFGKGNDNRFGWLERALVGDIQTLLNAHENAKDTVVGGGNLSIAILVCIGIELASALYAGKTRYLGDYKAEENVKKFIFDYFTGRVRWIPSIIWDGVRNGVDHLFYPKAFQYDQTTIRFSFYVEGESAVCRNNGSVEIMINSIELFHILEHAIKKYKQILRIDNILQGNFITAWDSIESPVSIKPTNIQKIDEVRYLLGELNQSNPFRLFGG